MKLTFNTAKELHDEFHKQLAAFPVCMLYRLDTIAPFPDFQSHDGVEIYYVWEGLGSYLVGDHIYPLRKGSLILIRPYTLHKILQSDASSHLCRHVLMWKASFLQDAWDHELAWPIATMDTDCWHFQLDAKEQLQVEALYDKINAELSSRDFGFKQMLQGCMAELILLLYRKRLQADQEPRIETHNSLSDEIAFLVQYIGTHYADPEKVSLKQLGRQAHLNEAYITTYFKKHTGYTIGQFIALRRIHHAKSLLRETDLPISEVALRCGYNDPSHFCRIFKSLAGATPLQYRKSIT